MLLNFVQCSNTKIKIQYFHCSIISNHLFDM